MTSNLQLHFVEGGYATPALTSAATGAPRRRKRPAELRPVPAPPAVTLRHARPADAPVVGRLAELDSVAPLEGDVLLALIDDEPVAALSLADGRLAADPFSRTVDAIELLRRRADGLAGGRQPSRRRRSLRARLAA
jgi:hypothetical protein